MPLMKEIANVSVTKTEYVSGTKTAPVSGLTTAHYPDPACNNVTRLWHKTLIVLSHEQQNTKIPTCNRGSWDQCLGDQQYKGIYYIFIYIFLFCAIFDALGNHQDSIGSEALKIEFTANMHNMHSRTTM